MKKLLLGLLFFLASPVFLCAQETETDLTSWEKTPHNFFVGYGIPSSGLFGFIQANSGSEVTTTQEVGPLFLKYEYRVSYLLGVGFNFAYSKLNVKEEDPNLQTSTGEIFRSQTSYSSYSFLMRFNLHALPYKDNIDIYAGLGVGTRQTKCDYTDNEPLQNYNDPCPDISIPVGLDLTLGVRLFFNEHIGMYSEVGIAKAIMQFGITGKF